MKTIQRYFPLVLWSWIICVGNQVEFRSNSVHWPAFLDLICWAGKAAVGRGFASYEDFVMHFDGMRLIACGFRLVTSWPHHS
jgi:hypothetical protein